LVPAVTALAGCGVPEGVGVAGFPAPPVVLTLGVADSPGRYSWDLAVEFARRAASASSGGVRVEVTDGDTEVPSRWNQALATRAQRGDVDLALVQAQSWDALGVSTLTALYVPFLVGDEEVLDAVATSEVAGDLLSGLGEVGVTGLALLPGGMRHLFRDGDAFLRPTDLEGRNVRVAYSRTVWSMFEAFGARPVEPNAGAVGRQVRDGTLHAVDSTFQLADSMYDSAATAGDLATYPLAFTLVANEEVLGRLTGSQRLALERAAHDTTRWAASTRPSEADAARALCARSPGAQVVSAGHAAVQEWVAATRTLATDLRADPDVDALAARIEELARNVHPRAEPVAPCRGRDGPSRPVPEPSASAWSVPEDFPDGSYRRQVSAGQLRELGVNSSDAEAHAGVWTITFRDGVFSEGAGCPGSTYTTAGARVVVTLGPEGPSCGEAAGAVLFSAGWHLEGTRLTFTDVRSGHSSDVLVAALFGGGPWTRIG
jgi:TRAP-type C4-dicarboxylate transport system substrate-binding protein